MNLRRNVIRALSAAIMCAPALGFAADLAGWEGDWVVHARRGEFPFRLGRTEGTWGHSTMPEVRAKDNVCFSRDQPIHVLVADDETLEFIVARNERFYGCENTRYRLKRMGTDAWTGTGQREKPDGTEFGATFIVSVTRP